VLQAQHREHETCAGCRCKKTEISAPACNYWFQVMYFVSYKDEIVYWRKLFGGFQNIRNSANKCSQITVVISILIIRFASVTTESSLPTRRCSSKTPTMESQIEKAYWTWKVEIDMRMVVAIIFNKHWLCKGKLNCSELQLFLTHWIRFLDSRFLEAPHSFSPYSADIVHVVSFLFWVQLTF
jgi:hypothetical protein